MIKVAYTNIQSKIKINVLLSDPFTLIGRIHEGFPLSMLFVHIAVEVLESFIDAHKRNKRIQIGDHEIKIVNFADSTTIFFRDITCLNRMHAILKIHKDASILKISFSKCHAL